MRRSWPRPETAAPALSEIAFPAMELYAMPAATQTLLDDAVVDLDAWLSAGADAEWLGQVANLMMMRAAYR